MVADVSRYLHAGGDPTGGGPVLEIEVEGGTEGPEPHDGEAVLASFDNGFELRRDGAVIVLHGAGCHARLDVAEGVGRVRVPPSDGAKAVHWTSCAVVLESLLILLRRYDLFAVHAAALAHDGRGIVLAGPADSGKSTLALRLVEHGWSYLSDDTILLDAAAEPLKIRGLRAHFSLDPEAEALFDGLAAGREASLLKDDKWAVNVEAVFPDRRAEACTPHALVFPQIEDIGESRLESLAAADAFGLLLVQSSLAQVKLDHTERHLAALGRLVGQTPVYRLHAGRDVLDEPSRVHALMHSLLDATFSTP